MGSYCELSFDNLSILDSKSWIPEYLISLFQETDRHIFQETFDDEEPRKNTSYRTSRNIILHRLDILGFTKEAAQIAFEEWLSSEREMYAEWVADGASPWAVKTANALNSFSYDEWKELAPIALSNRYKTEKENEENETVKRMSSLSEDWLFFECNDQRLVIRALLEACTNAKEVILDVTDLIEGGWLEEDAEICNEAREPASINRPSLEPIIILGEGGSDIKILRSSLEVMYPHLKDYFAFFEHDELNVDGGANYLLKFLKAFAAARISTRLIAIFDNDTTGRECYQAAIAMNLPNNIKPLKLPDIPIARNYPSFGPQGAHLIDANGYAASIEMYLGEQNLKSADGQLTPIRWRGYSPKMNAYQGELEGKSGIVAAFNKEIKKHKTAEAALNTHPELVAIWEMIFNSAKQFQK
jgi:hypothetical protein